MVKAKTSKMRKASKMVMAYDLVERKLVPMVSYKVVYFTRTTKDGRVLKTYALSGRSAAGYRLFKIIKAADVKEYQSASPTKYTRSPSPAKPKRTRPASAPVPKRKPKKAKKPKSSPKKAKKPKSSPKKAKKPKSAVKKAKKTGK
jgi:hypothetical protein